MQFTIVEVGSELVPTETTFQVQHNGQSYEVLSQVDIMLTSNYARCQGFNVAQLRAQGLILDRPGNKGQGNAPSFGGPPPCPEFSPVCGNGVCEGEDDGEDCFSCPDDCGCTGNDCSDSCCGDGECAGGGAENPGNCSIDCGP